MRQRLSTELHFHAIANFVRTFDFRPDDRLVFLTDKLLDPRVVAAITVSGLASEDDHGLIVRILEDYLAEE